MKRHLDQTLLGYAAAASAAIALHAQSAHATLVYGPVEKGSVGAGGDLVDGNTPGGTILQMGNDGSQADPTGNDGIHLYLTNKNQTNNASYVYTGNPGTGAVANLAVGTTVGPSLATGLAFDNAIKNTTDNDIAYVDPDNGGTIYLPNSSDTPSQFQLNTTGYFGFSYEPGTILLYGYAAYSFDANGNTSVQAVYDDMGNSVTVAPVPEPSALSALAIGAVAMIRRNRKH